MELEPRTTAPVHATGAVEFVPLAAISDDATFRLREVGDVSALAASMGRLGHLVPVELRRLPPSAGGPRYQVVAGFRRLAALRLLARERVLARVHATLDDDDAWGIALAQALLGEPLSAADLDALRARLAETRVAPWAEELVDEALVRAPVAPEQREQFLAFLGGSAGPVAEPDEAGDTDGEEEERNLPRPRESGGEGWGEGEGSKEEGSKEEGSEEEAADPDAPLEVTADELAEDLAQRMFEMNQDLALAFEAWAELPEEGRRMIVEQARYVAELYPHLTRGRR
jgi:ParB-like chromosome segregation protein Spo0J